jgi:hypothetical protein
MRGGKPKKQEAPDVIVSATTKTGTVPTPMNVTIVN